MAVRVLLGLSAWQGMGQAVAASSSWVLPALMMISVQVISGSTVDPHCLVSIAVLPLTFYQPCGYGRIIHQRALLPYFPWAMLTGYVL